MAFQTQMPARLVQISPSDTTNLNAMLFTVMSHFCDRTKTWETILMFFKMIPCTWRPEHHPLGPESHREFLPCLILLACLASQPETMSGWINTCCLHSHMKTITFQKKCWVGHSTIYLTLFYYLLSSQLHNKAEQRFSTSSLAWYQRLLRTSLFFSHIAFIV